MNRVLSPEQLDAIPAGVKVCDFEGRFWVKEDADGHWERDTESAVSAVLVEEYGPIQPVGSTVIRCTCIRARADKTLLVRDPDCPATLLHELLANPRRANHETH